MRRATANEWVVLTPLFCWNVHLREIFVAVHRSVDKYEMSAFTKAHKVQDGWELSGADFLLTKANP